MFQGAARESCSAPVVTFGRIGQHGRLGNQLFQVAATIGIAEENGMGWQFPRSIRHTTVGRLFRLSGKLNLEHLDIQKYDEESLSYYQPKLNKRHDTKYISLHGYFQDPRYFEKSRRTLREHLQPSPALVEHVHKNCPDVLSRDSIVIHVRRGDYIKFNHIYAMLPIKYYTRALSLFHNVSKVIIVSDDIDWCKEKLGPHLDGRSVIYSPFNDEMLDFVLMYIGKRLIIANSTFSWWAAYLKSLYTESSSIVAPRLWYNTTGPLAYLNRDDFYPRSWTVITPDDGYREIQIAQ